MALTKMQRDFPAKFSEPILDCMAEVLQDRGLSSEAVFDFNGGVGGIHKLADRLPNLRTAAVEIESEFAAEHDRTVHADASTVANLDAATTKQILALLGVSDPHEIRVVGASPSYGNRLSDQYLGSDNEKCRKCNGKGRFDIVDTESAECEKCSGSGHSKSKRYGYAIAKGAKLVENNAARLSFGAKYQDEYTRMVANVHEFVGPNTTWLLNVSSSLKSRNGEDVYVAAMEWWLQHLATFATIEDLIPIETKRHGEGKNRERRVPVEHLIIATT